MPLYYEFKMFVRHPRPASTKCPCGKMAGDEVCQRQNDWWQSVPTTKWLATKCPRDEMASDEVPRNEMASDEMTATKWLRRKGVYPAGTAMQFLGVQEEGFVL